MAGTPASNSFMELAEEDLQQYFVKHPSKYVVSASGWIHCLCQSLQSLQRLALPAAAAGGQACNMDSCRFFGSIAGCINIIVPGSSAVCILTAALRDSAHPHHSRKHKSGPKTVLKRLC